MAKDVGQVVVIGTSAVDLIFEGVNELPGRGLSTQAESVSFHAGGTALNTAIGLSKLGIPTKLLTSWSTNPNDPFSALLEKPTARSNLTIVKAADQEGRTPVTFVAVDTTNERERSFVHCPGLNSVFGLEFLQQAIADNQFEGTKICMFSSIGNKPNYEIDPMFLNRIIRPIKHGGTKIAMDVVPIRSMLASKMWQDGMKNIWNEIDYFMPNQEEAESITGCADYLDQARVLCGWGIEHVFIKLAKQGVFALDRKTESTGTKLEGCVVPGPIEDSTGAGDAWCAGFIAGIFRGYDITNAARLGNSAASFCLEKVGATRGIPKTLEAVVQRSGIRH